MIMTTNTMAAYSATVDQTLNLQAYKKKTQIMQHTHIAIGLGGGLVALLSSTLYIPITNSTAALRAERAALLHSDTPDVTTPVQSYLDLDSLATTLNSQYSGHTQLQITDETLDAKVKTMEFAISDVLTTAQNMRDEAAKHPDVIRYDELGNAIASIRDQKAIRVRSSNIAIVAVCGGYALGSFFFIGYRRYPEEQRLSTELTKRVINQRS